MFQRDAKSTFFSILTGFVIHASAFVSVIRTDTSSIFLCRVSENWWCPWVEGCPRSLCLCEFLRQLSNQKKKYHSYPHSMKVDVSFLFLFIFLFLRFSGVFPPSTLNIKIYVFQVPILSMKLYAKTGHACFSLAILWWGFGSQAISNLLPIYSSSTIVGFHLSP